MTLFDKKSANTEVGCNTEVKDIAMAHLHTHTVHSIPLFDYDPPKVGRHNFGTIRLGDEIFHNISNMEDFYIAMGHDESARRKHPSGEEFIWERYTRDNAKMSKHCLQIQIQVYLHKNSTKFRELYGHKYDEMLGNCSSKVVNNNDKHCANCPMARGGHFAP